MTLRRPSERRAWVLALGTWLCCRRASCCRDRQEIKAKALCIEEDRVVRESELLVLLLGVRDNWHVHPAPSGAGDGQKDIGNVARRSQGCRCEAFAQCASLPGSGAHAACARDVLQATDDDGGAFTMREGPAGAAADRSFSARHGYRLRASVQRPDVGTPFMQDRQIMRATLLRGTHVTTVPMSAAASAIARQLRKGKSA